MKKIITPIIVIFVIFIGVLVAGPFYIINEGEQAVIIQMGRLVRVVTDAGLYIKIPVIEEVVRYPKRIIAWDGESNIMPTRERQFIFVDVTARWRISDPQVFYEAISSISAAHSKLGEIIDSEVRTVVAENYIHESIRNSNLLLYREESADSLGIGELDAEIISTIQRESEDHAPIERGRRQLAEEILARSKRMVPEYGIELIDVVTRQIRYSDDLTQSVYARMIKERNQIAQRYRSLGEGRKASWLGRLENDKRSILSAAYTQAETIRGRADAEASQIYADAYNRDRGFFEFWRATESYRSTMPKFSKTLSTDMDYFRYLYSPR